MLRGIYASAMGMQVQDMRQEAISNNLANVSTTGFKRTVMAFSADLWGTVGRLNDNFVKTPLGVRDKRPSIGFLRGGAMLSKETQDWSEGNLTETGNPLDVALREPPLPHQPGPGESTRPSVHMFELMDGNGRHFYTKNGEFSLSPEGYLITKDGGYFVLVRDPNTGITGPTKITMHRPTDPTDNQYWRNEGRDGLDLDNGKYGDQGNVPFDLLSGRINISSDGLVSITDVPPGVEPEQQNRPVGFLQVMRVPVEGLVPQGRNVYTLTNDLLDPNDPKSHATATQADLGCYPYTPVVKSGTLEGSNVSTVKEMVALLAANRIYEMNSRLIRAQDEQLGKAVSDVGRSTR